jgi:hypothetical protein
MGGRKIAVNVTTGNTTADGGIIGLVGNKLNLVNYENDDLQFGTNNAVRLIMNNVGNVGLNTAPTANHVLKLSGGYLHHASNLGGSAHPDYIAAAGGFASSWNFSAGGAEIDFWNVSGLALTRGFLFRQMTSANTSLILTRISGNGDVTATSFSNFSDEQLKKSFNPISINELNALHQLPVYSYYFDQAKSAEKGIATSEQLHFGVKASELEKLYPNLVKTDANGVKSVNYIELIPILIAANQQLEQRVRELEQKK